MIPKDWKVFHHYLDYTEAQCEAGRLTMEGIPVRVESDMLLPGLNTEYRVLIPIIFEEQAQQIMAESTFTEEELNNLADATSQQTE